MTGHTSERTSRAVSTGLTALLVATALVVGGAFAVGSVGAQQMDDGEANETSEAAAEEAALAVTSLTTPDSAAPGSNVSVAAQIENPSDAVVAEHVEYRVDGTVVDTELVSLEPGESETVQFSTNASDEGGETVYHGVFTAEDGRLGQLTISESFEVESVDVPDDATVGETVTVEAAIANPNDFEATQGVALRQGGQLAEHQNVTVDADDSTDVTFEVATDELEAGDSLWGVLTREQGAFVTLSLAEAPEDNETETPEENVTETPEENVTETPTETPEDNETETPTEMPGDNETETPTETPEDNETETPTETPEENETETPTETPEENVTETPTETPEENETETPTETPEDNETETPEEEPAMENASIAFDSSNATSVVVDRVTVPEGGFLAIHNESLADGDAVGSVIGVSEYLDEGTHEFVRVHLFEVPGAEFERDALEESQTLIAMPHQDTNDNETFDFVSSNGSADGPYTVDGEALTDEAYIQVDEPAEPPTETPTETPEENVTETPTETPEDNETETPTETPEDNETETPTETPEDNETETPTETPEDNETETPTETPEDNETETPTETPEDNVTETPEDNVTETPEENVTETPEENETETPEENVTETPEENVTETPEDNETETPEANVTQSADVAFENQTTNGTYVTIESVNVSDGGYVVIHNDSLLEGNVTQSVIGVSEHLEPGEHEAVNVTLYNVSGADFEQESLSEDQTLIAMPHLETNDNETYDFVATNGSEDGPYTADGEAVTDDAFVQVEGAAAEPPEENVTETPEENVTETPEENVTETPEENVTETPEENVTETPEENESAPAEPPIDNETETPEENVTETPEENESAPAEPPIDNETETPEENVTETPEENVTEMPEDNESAPAEPPVDNETETPEDDEAGPAVPPEDDETETPEDEEPEPVETVTAPPAVNFENQTTDDANVTVDSVTVTEGGFLAIHNESLLEGDAVGSVVGVSEFLRAGTYENLTVELFEVPGADLNESELEGNETLIAMPHRDSDSDEAYDFVTSNGTEDPPYVADDEPVTDNATVAAE